MVVFGKEEEVKAVFDALTVSNTINTALIEWHNGTDRNWDVWKTYSESDDGRLWHPRTIAMTAGLSDNVWPLEEWLPFPIIQSR